MDGQVLHVVWSRRDGRIDSIWTCRHAADSRVEKINNDWGVEYAFKTTYYANQPDGLCTNLGKK